MLIRSLITPAERKRLREARLNKIKLIEEEEEDKKQKESHRSEGLKKKKTFS